MENKFKSRDPKQNISTSHQWNGNTNGEPGLNPKCKTLRLKQQAGQAFNELESRFRQPTVNLAVAMLVYWLMKEGWKQTADKR